MMQRVNRRMDAEKLNVICPMQYRKVNWTDLSQNETPDQASIASSLLGKPIADNRSCSAPEPKYI